MQRVNVAEQIIRTLYTNNDDKELIKHALMDMIVGAGALFSCSLHILLKSFARFYFCSTPRYQQVSI